MKFYVLIFMLFLLVSCSNTPPTDNTVSENLKANNKETALKNEVNSITREAQILEKQGRAMEMFRHADNIENDRARNASMEGGQRQIKDLEARIIVLPDTYKNQLSIIIPDLSECVSCNKKAMESCVKARASINKAIKELFPQ